MDLKNNMVCYMKRLCENKLTTSLGGNISCKTEDSVLITPSGIDKNSLSVNDIVELDMNSNVVSGIHKPSMEYIMHMNIYKKRKDVFAIVHSHSFFSTLLPIINHTIDVTLTGESAKNIGMIGTAEYFPMGTIDLANAVSSIINKHNVILMKNHGIITVGSSITEALYRLEVAENAAMLTYYSLGFDKNSIPELDVKKYFDDNLKKIKENSYE